MPPAAPRTTWLTAHQAAAHANRARRVLTAGHPTAARCAQVTERTVRSWVARGHLAPAGRSEGGLQLFTLADVARAEQATRARALRLVGIPATWQETAMQPTARPPSPQA